MKRVKLVCAGLALVMTSVVVPSAVSAKDNIVVTGETQPTKVVGYADLNLNHEDGVNELVRRVRRAAATLCMDPGTQPIGAKLDGWACRDAAIAGAQNDVDRAINSLGRYAAAQTITVALK